MYNYALILVLIYDEIQKNWRRPRLNFSLVQNCIPTLRKAKGCYCNVFIVKPPSRRRGTGGIWLKYSEAKPRSIWAKYHQCRAEARWFYSIYSEQTIAEASAVVKSIQVCLKWSKYLFQKSDKFICGYLV